MPANHVVLQSSNVFSQPLIDFLCGRFHVQRFSEHHLQLPFTSLNDELIQWAEENQIDVASIPANRALKDISLVVMDMDSTLITIECIDEIADFMGIKPQVASITESAMRGDIDFSESLKRRVSLLEGLPEQTLYRVYQERLRITSGGEPMLETLHQRGIETLLVSGGFTFFTEHLKRRLNLTYCQANTLEIKNGYLTGRVLGDIVDAQGKAYWLQHYLKSQKNPKQAVAIGDGANDLLMMKEADISIAFHAKPSVKKQATHALNWVALQGVIPLLEVQQG